MANGVKYLIMTVVFLIAVKVWQVTVFDSKQYEANSKAEEKRYAARQQQKQAEEKRQASAKLVAKKKSPDTKQPKSQNPAEQALQELQNTYLKPLLSELPPDGLRKDIFIRYYRHNKDGIGVYKLEEMGYYMHQKPATETAGLGSNVIYYGDDVPLEDIQIVALTLLKEGIPLKSIQHTKFEWKSSAIEIGTDTALIEEPNMTLANIKEFDKEYLGGY